MATLNASTFASRSDAEKHFLAMVDEAAEKARQKHLTSGSGQAMTYEIKYREALIGSGEYIESEAAELEITLQEVINSIIEARQISDSKMAFIESKRLKAKKMIRMADNAAQMHAIAARLNPVLDSD